MPRTLRDERSSDATMMPPSASPSLRRDYVEVCLSLLIFSDTPCFRLMLTLPHRLLRQRACRRLRCRCLRHARRLALRVSRVVATLLVAIFAALRHASLMRHDIFCAARAFFPRYAYHDAAARLLLYYAMLFDVLRHAARSLLTPMPDAHAYALYAYAYDYAILCHYYASLRFSACAVRHAALSAHAAV